LQKTNFIHDGLPVGASRRKLKDCEGQILPAGRPSFNFQQFLGRFQLLKSGSQSHDFLLQAGRVKLNDID
jgi:hypothetical protein